MWTALALLLFSTGASAQTPESEKPVIFLNGYYDSGIKNYFPPDRYRYYDKQAERKEFLDEGYLPPLERDALFRKLNIETKLQQLDQMDKDMLVMGAKAYSAKQLHKQYPMLSLKEVERLKKEVGRIK